MPPRRSTAVARTTTGPRVLLAEEETLVRDALLRVLETDVRVVGAVPDLDALRSAAARLRPDVVVAGLPLLAGRDPAEVRALREAFPALRFVVVAREPANGGATAAAIGAARWVLRSSTAEELVAAVRAAGRRATSLAPVAADARPGRGAGFPVTPRAVEVVRLIARGKVMKEVAADLGISARTVAFHKYKAMRDLGLDSTAALVRYAVRNHML